MPRCGHLVSRDNLDNKALEAVRKQSNIAAKNTESYSIKHRQEKGRVSTAWADWFEQATLDQKQALNPIYAQALQEGYDAESLIVDLGQEEREAIIHDDGMLSAG